MEKKEILELKRRLQKTTCTISKIAGCYVNSSKEKMVSFVDDFLELSDEEIFKYLDIARRPLSGNIGETLKELALPMDDDAMQNDFSTLKDSGLSDDAILEGFYDYVLSSFPYEGHYYILLFYDVYGVPTKTKGSIRPDMATEEYDYIICAICPVSLSKAGLCYVEKEKRIGCRNREWIVNVPDIGFIYHVFSNGAIDDSHAMVYTKKDLHSDPQKGYWEDMFCQNKGIYGCFGGAYSRREDTAIGVGSDRCDPDIMKTWNLMEIDDDRTFEFCSATTKETGLLYDLWFDSLGIDREENTDEVIVRIKINTAIVPMKVSSSSVEVLEGKYANIDGINEVKSYLIEHFPSIRRHWHREMTDYELLCELIPD